MLRGHRQDGKHLFGFNYRLLCSRRALVNLWKTSSYQHCRINPQLNPAFFNSLKGNKKNNQFEVSRLPMILTERVRQGETI